MEPDLLIISAQRGSLAAFNQLVLTYQDQAYATALYMLNEPECAADALQNALILAYKNIGNFRGGSFRAWLMRILKNVCYDELRRQKRCTTQPLEPVVDGEEFESPDWMVDHSQNPVRQVENAELSRLIERGLSHLAPEYRLTLILVDIDGMDYEEAAEVMGVPMGTVKSRLARARMRLRKSLLLCPDALPEHYALEGSRCLAFAC